MRAQGGFDRMLPNPANNGQDSAKRGSASRRSVRPNPSIDPSDGSALVAAPSKPCCASISSDLYHSCASCANCAYCRARLGVYHSHMLALVHPALWSGGESYSGAEDNRAPSPPPPRRALRGPGERRTCCRGEMPDHAP